MHATKSLNITLPLEMAEMVEAKVASGQYASESDVIRDGLRTLAAQDAALDHWLVEEVGASIDAIDRGIVQTFSLREARDRLHARVDRLAANKNR